MPPAFLLLMWKLFALAAEILLLATHLKVLLCIGKPYKSSELSSKRWTYFLFDAISPWNSLAALLAGGTSSAAAASWLFPALITTALGHGALHVFYICTWARPHASNVINMSAAANMRSRWERFNAAEVAWFLFGTTYDIITHAALSALLAQQLLQPDAAAAAAMSM